MRNRNRRKTQTRNAGLFFLLIGLVMTVAVVTDLANERYQENRERMEREKIQKLMLYRTLLKDKAYYGDSFTIDEDEGYDLPWKPSPGDREMW